MNPPPYKRFPHLSGNKISLREIKTSDVEALVPISYYYAKLASTTAEAAEMQKKINQDYASGDSIHWGIFDQDNHIVGTCGYYRGFESGAGELGCILLPEFTGKSYMSEALQLAIDFGRNQMQLNRIFAITSSGNEKAIRLLERTGFSKLADLEGSDIEYELK